MAKTQNTAGTLLQKSLEEKKRKNPAYSARALARDLNVSPSFLSMVVAGKKRLSLEKAVAVSDSLGLSRRQRQLFLKTVSLELLGQEAPALDVQKLLFEPSSSEDFVSIEVDQFQLFNQWYHIAVMDLLVCRDFSPEPTWIARRLGINEAMAASAMERLRRLGLIENVDGVWRKTSAEITVPTAQSHLAIRRFHSQMIEKAQQALGSENHQDFQRREISGLTMAIDASRMAEAKTKISQFKREMYELFGADETKASDVYQLNVQFFSLTTPEESE